MRIGILHLSDLHLEAKKAAAYRTKVDSLAGALGTVDPSCKGYIIVVSGDVAYAGQPEEYKLATELLAGLKSHLESLKSSPVVQIVLIPGNHDCNFDHDSDTRAMALAFLPFNMATFDTTGPLSQACLAVQEDFFTFHRSLLPTVDLNDRFAWRHTLDFDGYRVVLNCINTSWLSQQKEIQGRLLVPVKPVNRLLAQQTEANLVISILHHPYNWFPSELGLDFRRVAEAGSDLILTGHEHTPSAMTRELFSGDSTQYFEGGVLFDTAEKVPSSANCIIVDFSSGQQLATRLNWEGGLYREQRYHEHFIPLHRNKGIAKTYFSNNETFKKVLTDIGTGFTHPRKRDLQLADLFVYPDLQHRAIQEQSGQNGILGVKTIPSKQVAAHLIEAKSVLILGQDLAGKTVLAKTLYADFKKHGLVPVMLSGRSFSGSSAEQITEVLRSAFSEQYYPDMWAEYNQLPSAKKAVIVDDLDASPLNRNGLSRVLELLNQRFDYMVCLAGELFELEEIAKDGDQLRLPAGSIICSIREFGHLLRSKLIERWVSLGQDHLLSATALTKEVLAHESLVNRLRGRSLLPSYPIVVLTILQSWEGAKNHDLSTGSFGYLYEMLIVKALSNMELNPTGLDVVMTYLSRLAHEMLLNDSQPLTRGDLERIQDEYYKKFRMRLPAQALERLQEARILNFGPGGGFRFQYPYYYYFFVARYFRDNLGLDEQRTTIRARLSDMAASIHVEDHAQILSFFVYLTKDAETIKTILSCARALFDHYEPCNLQSDVEFLNALLTRPAPLILTDGDITTNRDSYRSGLDEGAEDEEEFRELKAQNRKERDQSLNDLLKINVATKMLQILGQVLRNSPGSLSADLKKELTSEAYLLGLRTLKAMLGFPKQHYEELRTYIAEMLKDHMAMQKQQPLNSRELADKADEGVLWVAERFIFGIVRRIALAVGLDDLEEIYAEVLRDMPDSLPFTLIDLSIKLELMQPVTVSRIKRLKDDLSTNAVAHNTLRELVYTYLYLSPVGYKERQALTSMMDIKVVSSKLIATGHKKPAKLLAPPKKR